ncbi:MULTISPECIES: cell division protein ZapE [Idiomarina]|jgi:cell division protein ZapE|uniref:Cell division protein ZapE n=2 Tax=Idiomarina TaxID=135575 RepID=A0A8I1G7V0_9GAMM|nr:MULTISPECIES: cell division protein ZapE [Idiomarina]MAO68671.1 cell division protein ZapE [Idiomarina sp.]MBF81178.1 cell division protein ZapE [Idiomarina sp.]MBJ7266615.1 AFG1 family ATPase [Idiomarina abyssalis]MBJ7273159.1 AFG1 family ATPase [Idiomarina abyssalis]MBJ7315786.1 AFG1 family ATPase [Idiomarina abyssalis]|tara:strand:- start:13864 stop:14958 length:1095 start_codon:yes stop_codon:yes gene_type:complete
MSPLERYQYDIEHNGFSEDEAQLNAVKHLQRLHDELIDWHHYHTLSAWRKLLSKEPERPQGIYFWGGVGRGKTYLVDTFFESLPVERKWRIHFHRFMHRVHNELKMLDKQSDPLRIVADKIADEALIVCFDEFFVQDITDAMLLGKLFEYLFERGVVLVATSNIIPDDLYKNGLQRARFIPAIKLIKRHCEVVNVDSGIDYRLRTLTRAEIFHSPLDDQADKNLWQYFKELAPECKDRYESDCIDIEGRDIDVRAECDDVVFFDFTSICKTARSQNDYMEIARIYHAVLISNVEQMGAGKDDTARRFIALVDEFYERRVKLILSAEVDIESLYTEGQLTFEFRRCVSRLQEMQSQEYLAMAHKA